MVEVVSGVDADVGVIFFDLEGRFLICFDGFLLLDMLLCFVAVQGVM